MRPTLLADLTLLCLYSLACTKQSTRKQLTLAVVSGVEGEALKQAARDYENQDWLHIEIAEFPYSNLFEKELIDLKARTGAYDLIMLDDPWFPRFAHEQVLTDLTPLLQKRGQSGPDSDFVETSLALCRHPYQTGPLYALPYVGNSQLFFYRKDLFEKYLMKPPATWDDVLAAAKTIQEKESAGANGCNRSTVTSCARRRAMQRSPTSCRSSGPSAARCLTPLESQRSIVRKELRHSNS